MSSEHLLFAVLHVPIAKNVNGRAAAKNDESTTLTVSLCNAAGY